MIGEKKRQHPLLISHLRRSIGFLLLRGDNMVCNIPEPKMKPIAQPFPFVTGRNIPHMNRARTGPPNTPATVIPI